MRKVLPYLGASLSVLALGWASAVKAQDVRPFEDVKPDHWAYQAVTDLQQKGIITGYPDKHFNGQRTLTRYEFAVALKRALDKVQTMKGDTGPQGEKGQQGDPGPAGAPGAQGAPGMTPEEVDELKRLTADFKNELAALGTNIKAVSAKLDSLSKQVADINKRLDKMIQFNGDFFQGVRVDRSRFAFADYGGAVRAANNSLFTNISTPSDFHLEAHANLPGGVKFNGDLVVSNYINYRGGNLGAGSAALPNAALGTSTGIYEANLVIPIAGVGSNTSLTVGRYKEQVTPLTYWRPDTDPYFDLPWYDDGKYVQDGFEIKTKFGSATTKLFGGSYSSVSLNNGVGGGRFSTPLVGSVSGIGGFGSLGAGQVRPGAAVPGQVVGFHGGIPLFKYGEIGLTMIDFSSTSGGAGGGLVSNPFGNVVVYGANVHLNPIGRFHISGEAAKSVTQSNFDTADGLPNDDNNAYLVNVGYNSGPVTSSVGYQYVDPRFAAPGYWAKVGNWYNPTNIQGPYARLGYKFSDKLSTNLGVDYLTGARNRPGVGGLTEGSSILHGLAGVKYAFNKTFNLSADYEGLFFDLSPAVSASGIVRGKPITQYITLGAGLNLTGNTVLKLNYQIISNSDPSSNGFGGLTGSNASVFTTQVAVHF